MSVVLHDPIHNVSVRISHDADGKMVISIKGRHPKPEVFYNDLQLVPPNPAPGETVAVQAGNWLGGGNGRGVGGGVS